MKWCAIIVICFFAHEIHAQRNFPSFNLLRYQEDYSFLKEDTSASVYKKLKYVRFSKNGNAFASFGGDIRLQYFGIQNEDWGDHEKEKNAFLLSRFLTHADVHLSPSIRAFAQLRGSMVNPKVPGISSADDNPLDFHQAFLEMAISSGNIILRLGRQEQFYGSQRLIAVPNNRHTFDAAKAVFRYNRLQLDIFYSRYVVAKKGFFDDRSDSDIQLWGVYGVINGSSDLPNADIYYLGLYRASTLFDDGEGNEERHSAGIRVWKKTKAFSYDIEGVYQLGRFAAKKIRAWTLSVNMDYQLMSVPLQPKFGLKADIISGDRKKGDDRLQTFNPLFPLGSYFGFAALIGPANLFDVHPSVKMDLWKGKLYWSVDYDAFWRHRTEDGIYAPGAKLLYSAGGSPEHFIGHQFATDVTYAPNPFLSVRAESTLFAPGPYLKYVSAGKSIVLLGITMQLKF